jgi:ATP-binding cassette subfamily B protein
MMDDSLDKEEQTRHHSDRELLAFLWPYIKPNLLVMTITLLCAIGAAVTSVFQPYVFKVIIDNHIKVLNFNGLSQLLTYYFLLLCAYFAFSWLQAYLSNVFGQRITWQLRVDLMKYLMSLKVDFFSKNPVGKLATRVTNDVANLNDMISAGFVSLISDFFLLVSIVAMMLFMDWRLTLVVMAAVVPVAIMLQVLGFALRRIWRVVRRIVSQMNVYAQEVLSGFTVVKAFTREELCEQEYDVINRNHYKYQLQAARIRVFFYPSVNFLREVARALVLFYGGYLISKGMISVGTIVSFFQLLPMMFDPIADFSDKFTIFQTAFASLEKIMDVMEVKEIEYSGKEYSAPLKGSVAFDSVSFAYDEELVLDDVSFNVKPGQTLAIVGPTGAGKSTMLNLLIGFYENYDGGIFVDDVELRNWNIEDYRHNLALVLQEVQLFHDTVRNNITLWDKASDQELEDILKTVNAQFVMDLPGGLDYMLAPEGANLSQGQRQLIAFARALYHKPKLLLLDEATANIDTDTERLIQNALPKLMKGRTTVVIAHRLSTIQQADKIIVVNHGKIVESGTHQELMARKGFYYELYTTQLMAGTAGVIE